MQSLAISRKTLRLIFNFYFARFSPSDIETVTRQIVRIGLCGSPELVDSLRGLLVGPEQPAEAPCPSLSLHRLPCDDPGNHWNLLEDCQMGVILLGRDELLDDTIYRVKDVLPKRFKAVWVAVGELEPWLAFEAREVMRDLKLGPMVFAKDLVGDSVKPILTAIARSASGHDLAMARKFAVLRPPVAKGAIRRVARQNLMIGMLSALPASVPLLGPLVGLLGVTGEIIYITSNQLRLALQLASLYGLDVRDPIRVQELLPIVGSAFGWRVLSRQLAGLVPLAGPGLKGAVAYAGTIACGAAILWFYQTGTYLDEATQAEIYEQALHEASTLDTTEPARKDDL
jgi:uncharacterized protein (DUF697 family)